MNPRSVAYVGASETPGTPGFRLIQVAQSSEYTGAIYPVNPKYESVQGIPCYGSLGGGARKRRGNGRRAADV